ncbi:cell wall-associated NlpC family hydrolase [Rheinheimera pacifica]|uniref:SH3 domain-containing protein n=1 Tax=Rheinheimera pacifica TaxID=173990 RepID=UPI002862E4E4|nr:SH3 domain-containing protein [Rheinheimera pacifica]MDR6981887.1 cell wall-associated NlpC family hydrolase [Rheinheimera pacifica]
MRKLLLLLCCWCSATVAAFAEEQFSTDVPLLRQEQLNSTFWQTTLTAADKLLLSTEQIAARTQQIFNQQSEMQLLQNLPTHYSKAELAAILQAVSSVPKTPRFYADGTEVTPKQWQGYTALLAQKQLKPQTAIQFGLVVKRTALRAFPTDDRVFNAQLNTDLDRFAETALFVADAVAVLHQSQDKQWLLVHSFNYTGWVKAADIAIGSKEQVLAYTAKAPFLVTTGAKVRTAYNPEVAAVSELQLDMGIRLPQLNAAEIGAAETGFKVHGQNPAASYIVQLPLRRTDGSLAFTAALIPRSEDMHQGYLPFTASNIVAQAFKFLGERYGWGHDYNGRDCTGFIGEIFRSFGFLMPRNSGQQGNGSYGRNIRFDSQSSKDEKLTAIQQAQVGDLLYFPGHVSLYLGMLDEQPFMIHDVNTLVYPTANGGLYVGTLNGVVVTPLLPLHANPEQSYLDALYAIKSLR